MMIFTKTTMELLDQVGILKHKQWVEDGRWIQPAGEWVFFSYWHKSKIVRKILPNKPIKTVFSVDGYAFWDKKTQEIMYADLEQRFKDGTLQELVDTIDADTRAVIAEVQAELGHDDIYIEKNIEKIIELCKEFFGAWTISSLIGDHMIRLAKEAGHISSDAELFAKVHPHLRATWIEQEVERVVHIAQVFLKKNPDQKDVASIVATDPELDSLVASYIHDFAWCRISKWIGELIDREYAYKRLAEEIENCRQGNHSKTVRTEETDRTLEGIVAMSVCSAYWRAQSAMMDMKIASRMRPIFNKIAQRNSCTYKQIAQLTLHELTATILDPENRLPASASKDVIEAREQGFFSTLTEDGIELILTKLNPEYTVVKNMYIKKADDSHTQSGVLKGIGASLGRVTGVVRVISSSKEFGDFKPGEILVAAETSPTFVPLMRMSAAILTGKGGITSHAAIVSRELGKPCVIAIKDVVKILKNGDRVEVDAGKGTVKIL